MSDEPGDVVKGTFGQPLEQCHLSPEADFEVYIEEMIMVAEKKVRGCIDAKDPVDAHLHTKDPAAECSGDKAMTKGKAMNEGYGELQASPHAPHAGRGGVRRASGRGELDKQRAVRFGQI